ncbi:MAG: YIP1 family protein [candidate division Zixibacteria bacterium]|nr:YIP1 family protein [candidate division Zixibacteria bacterium]
MEPQSSMDVQPQNGISALAGVVQFLFKPREVFSSLKQKSNWILPLVVLVVLAVAVTNVIYPVLKSSALTSITERPNLTEEQKTTIVEQMADSFWMGRAWMTMAGVIGTLLLIFIVAAVFYFVANVLMGGSGSYLKMLSVTSLSYLVAIPENIVATPLILAKNTMKIHTDLALFLPVSMDQSFIYRLLGHLNVFTFWKVYLIGLGISVLYGFTLKKSLTATLTVWLIYVILASVLGGFLNFGAS